MGGITTTPARVGFEVMAVAGRPLRQTANRSQRYSEKVTKDARRKVKGQPLLPRIERALDRVVKGKFCAEEGRKGKILSPLFITDECLETPDSAIAADQFEDSNLVYCWNRTIEIRCKV